MSKSMSQNVAKIIWVDGYLGKMLQIQKMVFEDFESSSQLLKSFLTDYIQIVWEFYIFIQSAKKCWIC